MEILFSLLTQGRNTSGDCALCRQYLAFHSSVCEISLNNQRLSVSPVISYLWYSVIKNHSGASLNFAGFCQNASEWSAYISLSRSALNTARDGFIDCILARQGFVSLNCSLFPLLLCPNLYVHAVICQCFSAIYTPVWAKDHLLA